LEVTEGNRTLQNSGVESGRDTERNLKSDRTNAPFLTGAIKFADNENKISAINSSKPVRFSSVTPEPSDLRTNIKFKKTNLEPSSQGFSARALEIQKQYPSEPNLSEPNSSDRHSSDRHSNEPNSTDRNSSYRDSNEPNIDEPNLSETFEPTSSLVGLKHILSIIKEIPADDEDPIIEKNQQDPITKLIESIGNDADFESITPSFEN
jgi:hypothetical protein